MGIIQFTHTYVCKEMIRELSSTTFKGIKNANTSTLIDRRTIKLKILNTVRRNLLPRNKIKRIFWLWFTYIL